MRVLKTSEYRTIEQLVALSQKELKEAMELFLKNKYKNIIKTDKYICATGDIPVALVAHLDTVFARPAVDVYYDPRKNVLWSPDGLGADDRAGIYAIVEIINSGLRPHIIFTTDEEAGGIGAKALANRACPFEDLKYIIQLDRRGAVDCVFYDCFNPDFTTYIESFGFVENWGTFSDISILCPAWKVCGVNLSIGYYDEHSYVETLNVGHMYNTIEKVKTILKQETFPTFKYKRAIRNHFSYLRKPTDDTVICCKCGFEREEVDTFPTKALDGSTKYYCLDCVDTGIEWCLNCQEPFEVDINSPSYYCKDCEAKIFAD